MVIVTGLSVLQHLQKGKHIETVTAVLDCENLSLQRHSFWPGIEILREVTSTWYIVYYVYATVLLCLLATRSFGLLDTSICV